LPSMIATHELVVPRSMPMILPMVLLPPGNFSKLVGGASAGMREM
jgi:hypothetical protein